MTEGNLTQEEIDALLRGADPYAVTEETSTATSDSGSGGADLSPLERETVADAILSGLRSGAQGLTTILNNRRVSISNPYPETVSATEAGRDFNSSSVYFTQKMSGGLQGTMFLVIPAADGAKISSVVMGSNGDSEAKTSLDSAQLATVKDTVGPLLYSVLSQFSAKVGQPVSHAGLDVKNGADGAPAFQDQRYLRIQYSLSIDSLLESKIIVLLGLGSARDFLNRNAHDSMAGYSSGDSGVDNQHTPSANQLPIQDVEFPSISTTVQGLASPNLDLLLDVQMTVTVELGRTKKYIKEILLLGEGSILELDKLAGEPVDLLVNGKLIAKGEVVVIDENFGVRVTDIVSSKDRLKLVKKKG
ncbi:MAG: flagellar motor switch protein FliN [Leptonema sp. (in: Bacteria)]|nr:flagellar motor switch protein FliN [Leptonema sp. (in: bacteria)]